MQLPPSTDIIHGIIKNIPWVAMKNSIFGLTSNLRIPFEHLFDSKSWENISKSRTKDFPCT